MRPDDALEPSGPDAGPLAARGASPTSASLSGNRPASGAREAAAPGSDTGWQPGPGATDFLGLEPELRGGPATSSEGPTESWLFDIEQADAGTGFAPETATATSVTPGTSATPADGADEFGQDAPPDPGESAADDPNGISTTAAPSDANPRSGAFRRLAAAAAVLALVSAGGFWAWREYGPRSDAPQIAANPPAPAPTAAKPKPKPAAKPTEPVATAPAATVEPPAASSPAADAGNSGSTEVAQADPAVDVDLTRDGGASGSALPVERAPVDGSGSWTTEVAPPAPVAVTPAPVEAPPPALVRDDAPRSRDARLPIDEPGPGGGRRATAADLANLWFEPTIPMDAIHGATRLNTPNVGLVRAELWNGEFLEGRLQAVGQSRVWIDVALGRMSLDAADLRGLVQVVGQMGQALPAGSQAIANLPRVEILLPGGTLVGRVLGREGDRVTFVTEEGMRMRVEPLDIRPASDGRSRLIGRAADLKKP